MIWELVDAIAMVVLVTWMLSGIVLQNVKSRESPRRLAMPLFMYTKPVYWPAWGFHYLIFNHEPSWIRILGALAYVYWWYKLKDEGDDRWKKLRKKAKEKIVRLGSRLIVVPAPSSWHPMICGHGQCSLEPSLVWRGMSGGDLPVPGPRNMRAFMPVACHRMLSPGPRRMCT